jgi:hypothetical protein
MLTDSKKIAILSSRRVVKLNYLKQTPLKEGFLAKGHIHDIAYNCKIAKARTARRLEWSTTDSTDKYLLCAVRANGKGDSLWPQQYPLFALTRTEVSSQSEK